MFEPQDKISELLSTEDTQLIPGSIGPRKDGDTLFINSRLKQFAFRTFVADTLTQIQKYVKEYPLR